MGEHILRRYEEQDGQRMHVEDGTAGQKAKVWQRGRWDKGDEGG